MPLRLARSMFCADGFHPSPGGYQLWSRGMLGYMTPLLADKQEKER
jgi:lysophospholipase L1-like esterase